MREIPLGYFPIPRGGGFGKREGMTMNLAFGERDRWEEDGHCCSDF